MIYHLHVYIPFGVFNDYIILCNVSPATFPKHRNITLLYIGFFRRSNTKCISFIEILDLVFHKIPQYVTDHQTML